MASELAVDLTADTHSSALGPHIRTPGLKRRGLMCHFPALLPLALVLVATLAAVFGRDPTHWRWAVLLAGLAALTLLASVGGHHANARLGFAFTATVAAFALPTQVNWWPIPGVIGVLVYFLCHLAAGRRSVQEDTIFRLGALTAVGFRTIVGLVGMSALGLLAFSHVFGSPRLGPVADLLTVVSPWSLVGIGLGFAMLNAFVEEVLFRGAVLHHLTHVVGAWPAVAVQALAFGLVHFHGYPYGPVGVVLAAAYGVVLGVLRLHSGGLFAPWVAHVCADVMIFVLMVAVSTG